MERGAAARIAFSTDGAAHEFDEALADRQAEASAAEAARRRVVGLRERIEDRLQCRRRNADAGVLHLEAQRHPRLGGAQWPHADTDVAVGRELDGIAQQVEKDLAEPVGVADHALGQRRLDAVGEPHVLVGGARGHQREGALDQFARRERPHVQRHPVGFDLREVEYLVDHVQEVGARAGNRLQVLALLGGQFAAAEEVGHAEHAVHRRADFVAHGGQEPRLGEARCLRRVPGRFELADEPAQFRVPALDLLDHAVEAVDQDAELVLGGLRRPGAVVLCRADPADDADELGDRTRDPALQAGRHTVGNHQRQHRGSGQHGDLPGNRGLDPLEARPHLDRAEQPAIDLDGLAQEDRADRVVALFATEADEDLAGRVEDAGGDDVPVRAQRAQHLAGRLAVVEGQGRRGIEAGHARGRGHRLGQCGPTRAVLGRGGGQDEQQRDQARGGERNRHDLVPNREPAQRAGNCSPCNSIHDFPDLTCWFRVRPCPASRAGAGTGGRPEGIPRNGRAMPREVGCNSEFFKTPADTPGWN